MSASQLFMKTDEKHAVHSVPTIRDQNLMFNNHLDTLKSQAYGFRDMPCFRLRLFHLHKQEYSFTGCPILSGMIQLIRLNINDPIFMLKKKNKYLSEKLDKH